MPPTDSARAHVEADGVVLEAVFVRESAGIRVDYRIRNTGAQALAVFDRGDRHAVLTRRQTPGDVGVPELEAREGDRAVLSHVARALPAPAPTVPPTPLARRVEPGATVDASFAFANWLDAPAQVQLDALSSQVDTVLHVVGGDIDIEDDDGGSGTDARLQQTLPAGHYTVDVSSIGGDSGLVELRIQR